MAVLHRICCAGEGQYPSQPFTKNVILPADGRKDSRDFVGRNGMSSQSAVQETMRRNWPEPISGKSNFPENSESSTICSSRERRRASLFVRLLVIRPTGQKRAIRAIHTSSKPIGLPSGTGTTFMLVTWQWYNGQWYQVANSAMFTP